MVSTTSDSFDPTGKCRLYPIGKPWGEPHSPYERCQIFKNLLLPIRIEPRVLCRQVHSLHYTDSANKMRKFTDPSKLPHNTFYLQRKIQGTLSRGHSNKENHPNEDTFYIQFLEEYLLKCSVSYTGLNSLALTYKLQH